MGSESGRYVVQGEDGKPVLDQTTMNDMYYNAYPTELATAGGNLKSSEGYYWKSSNTSQSNMQYDYGGRLTFWQNSSGKAFHQTYDVNGLIDTSYNNADHTRTYDIKYDTTGRMTQWETKNTGGQQSVYGKHTAEYNTLGQIVTQKD